MPTIKVSKEEIKGNPPMTAGIYTVQLKGFKPSFSKKKDSVNLNPQLEVINHPEYNNRPVFESLNTKAKWAWKPFFSAFGFVLTEDGNGDYDIPVTFVGPENDPSQWKCSGPIIGCTAQLKLKEVQNLDPLTGQPAMSKQGYPTRNEVEAYIDATDGKGLAVGN
jgi:hypothetical protein